MSRRQLERTVLEALADGEPRYAVDLAARIDEHPVTVEGACDRLHENGGIRSVGCRRYEITATGHRRLADVQPATSGSDVRTEGRP
ncbi:MarR family transcriptional regulator [Natrinema longum]|uniref:MarR family transcriptional regulator n=1 Tax=Natrinema longum TaxID=370324 RepID=A0A8A2UBT6_9EURY|nr:MarR family transcriptional regulator [Natrinema longum]MBZ6495903.1 MarR family transcriptional regulator [Natrinema longum]QSW86156.1 MarR family transcriptional regulator [Natrinema longum]